MSLTDGLRAFEELETKLPDIDPDDIAERLEALGAEHKGVAPIKERIYKPTELMKAENLTSRLRRIGEKGDPKAIVEYVMKQKLPPLLLPGFEELGPKIKARREFEVFIGSTLDGQCGFDTHRAILKAQGLEVDDRMKTERITYLLDGVKYELKKILTYNRKNTDLPGPFLEIEGPTVQSIMLALQKIDITDFSRLSPRSSRGLVEEFRSVKVD